MSYKIKTIKRLKLLRSSAKKRNISVDINIKHYEDLLSMGCTYCDKDLSNDGGYCLDRVDNSLGYNMSNCLPSCWDCNRAKGKMSFNDFIDLIERIYKHHKKELAKFQELDIRDFKKAVNITTNKSSYKNSGNVKIEGDR